MRCRAAILVTLSVLISPVAFAESTCRFNSWISYQGTKLLAHPTGSAYLFASTHMAVDADGAPNAYHPDDMGLHCIRGEGFKGLDCPGNAGYPTTSWWPSVLVPDPANPSRAYTQPSGEFAGYFVSKTSLHDESKLTIDPKRYVDARNIPYLVFPGSFYRMKGTGLLGDLGYAVNLATGEQTPFVVTDIGPAHAKLGEVSIALAAGLGGKNPNPRTGEGTPKGTILYIVFPYSSRSHAWPLSMSEIERHVNHLLERSDGLESAMACKDAL